MRDTECPHGDLLTPDTCTLCLHGPPVVRPIPSPVSTFCARYEGNCIGCSLPIYVGQIIHGLSNGAFCHQGCEP